jgi:2-hydroxymuconate-semialdehyde hydrolase
MNDSCAQAHTVTANPEIGKSIIAAGIATNYHEHGSGPPLLLIHGSGPGVSAWANWRTVIPTLARHQRVLALDMVGFGFTERPPGIEYGMQVWLRHIEGFLDAMDVETADFIGNSFGGGIALAFAIRHPGRVRRLVLMGSAGVSFPITPGLEAVWGYTPSVENMRKMMEWFAYDKRLISDDLARLRYEASIRSGVQESYSSMFPAPRQQGVDALASDPAAIQGLPHEVLMIHGRDDRVVPLSTSLTLSQLIPRSQLHVFGQCGHWTQIEKCQEFGSLVTTFLSPQGRDS